MKLTIEYLENIMQLISIVDKLDINNKKTNDLSSFKLLIELLSLGKKHCNYDRDADIVVLKTSKVHKLVVILDVLLQNQSAISAVDIFTITSLVPKIGKYEVIGNKIYRIK